MKLFLVLTLLAAVFCGGSESRTVVESPAQSNVLEDFQSDYPVGDARWCMDRARKNKFDLNRFEVLPGLGWDNLRNVEAGMVVSYNFTQCKVTDDGRFLIPDSVFTVPIKSSTVQSFAEVIDTWLNTSSTTSHTVNVQASLSLSKFAASGSFSYEHTHLKSKQVEDAAVTVRVQLRYSRYESKLQPDPVLSPGFKSRLLEMAASIELNNTDQARYDGQLLIRDYGTHYLTNVVAGAALVKDDYLRKKYISSQEESKTNILAKASASFFSVFKMSASYGYSSDSKTDTSYNKQVTNSYIKAHGGPLLGANATAEKWIAGVDLNLVPVDRAGEPLYFLVTERMLPELPRGTVAELEKIVRHSVELYYEMNTIRGCTKIGAPNFSFSANFDDGSCHKEATNMTFGGVYQTCSDSGRFLNKNPCSGLQQVNPLTGKFSCPPNYQAVKLHSGAVRTSESQRNCHHCWLFFHCCHTDQYQATGTYTSYWCAATGPVPEDSGYLFGGLFTNQQENPVTRTHACPANFYALRLFTDLQVCLSDDFELSAGQSMPFGGFFSCDSGNPLSTGPVHPVSSSGTLKADARPSLGAFMASNNGNDHKSNQKCPHGYSQHIATTVQGCSVHYCILSGFLSGPLTPPVKRPPYIDPPSVPAVAEDNLLMFDLNSQTWLKNEKAREYQTVLMTKLNVASPEEAEMKLSQTTGGSGLSVGAAAGISVAVTLACVAVATVVVVVVQRRRSKGRGTYRRLVEESFEPRSNYGSAAPGSSDVPGTVVSVD